MSDKHPENVAKRVLEMAIPGARMVFRPEQSHGEYDFYLRYPNGDVAAVEVTSSRDQASTKKYKDIFEKNGGFEIKAVCCKKNWCITPSGPDINRIRKDVDKYLAALEAAGIDRFSEPDYTKSNTPKEVTAIYRDLNVVSGQSFPTSGASVIRMSAVFGGGAIGQTSPTSAAEREIGPNKDKLGKATTKERHLVVYVDMSNDQQWIGMTSSEPPNRIPNLPTEITHLWQIAQTEKNQFVVWRATSTEPWHTVELSAASQRYSEGEKQNA
jgi:hypothetical protein